MRQTISIRLSKEEMKTLDLWAKKERVERSDLVREALRRYLWLKELHGVRRRLIPQARRQGIYTDEDVFRIVS
jgi:metal-responsive CopG/Arc/MetJ family transcriptional regulator